MKVKIGDTLYDSTKEPIMLILSPQDKQNIANMAEGADCFCSYPSGLFSEEDIDKFMDFLGSPNPS